MNLESIPVGEQCRILDIQGDAGAVRRAKELGLVRGVVCRVVRKAPFNGPIELAMSLAHIGVRTSDELRIEVEPIQQQRSEAA